MALRAHLLFQFNCEHFLFVYIVKQKQTKKFANIIEKCGGFLKFDDIQILLKANFFVVF